MNEKQLIYNSREAAYLSLLTSEVKTGRVYLKCYKDENGKLDVLMAYGVKDCTTGYPDSIDSIKIISGNSPFLVYNVVFNNPDVSELAKGQVYLYVDMNDEKAMDCEVKLLTIEKGEDGIYRKKFIDFGETKRYVYSLSQGEFYYVSNSSFRPAENFYTRDEVDGLISNIMDVEIGPAIKELLKTVYPIKINFGVNPGIAEKGTSVNVKLDYSVLKKDTDITRNCNISVLKHPEEESIIIPPNKTINVSESGNILDLCVEFEGELATERVEIPFVYRTYWGILPFSDIDTLDSTKLKNILRSLKESGNSSLRTKDTFTYSDISLDLSQTVVYIYPAIYGNLSSIKDVNGFEYISDYNKFMIKFNGVDYFIYYKTTPIVITQFKQIYSF